MKAVLWADTVQMVIVYAGLLTVLIKGCSVLGGFDKTGTLPMRVDVSLFSSKNCHNLFTNILLKGCLTKYDSSFIFSFQSFHWLFIPLGVHKLIFVLMESSSLFIK